MSTSYKEVEEFHRVREPGTKSRLRELDEALSKERDTNKDKVPLYGNNWRVKTVNSIYLKLRRKNMVLDKLTDFGGMRLLCMFEQDLVPVHRALLSVLNPRFELKEIEVHNLDNANLVQELEISTNEIAKKARGYEFHRSQDQDSENSAVSGYKSIHYSVCWKEEDNTRSFIEIQLRTLVQEVWAELSHTLSYKQGRVHPHVTKGFDLLARDLSKADKLLTHLRHTSDREQTIGAYSLSKLGPYKVFWYDAARLPSVFQKNPLKAFSDYAKHVRKGADGKISSAHQKAWIAKRWELYSGELAEMDLRKSENGKEWKTIEEAYFMFCCVFR